MVLPFLVIAGSAFALTFAVGTVSAIVKKVRDNKVKNDFIEPKSSETSSKLEKKSRNNKPQKKQTTSKKEVAIKQLQNKIDAVIRDNEKIDSLIKEKIDSLKLDPNTDEHKEFLFSAIKTRWVDTSSKYINQVEKVKNSMNENDDFEVILSKVPSMASAETFIEKCQSSLIPSVSEKYRYYASEKEKIDLKLLDSKRTQVKTKEESSRKVISALFKKIENMIIDGTKVSTFKSNADVDFKTISNEIENVRAFRSQKANFSTALLTIEELLKEKTSSKDLSDAVEKLEKQIKENEEKIEFVDIEKVYRTIRALQKKTGISIDKLSEELKELIESKVKIAKEKVSDRFKYELSLLDLISLREEISCLEEKYQTMDDIISENVRSEVSNLKTSIDKGLSTKIGRALSKRVKELDEKRKNDIINLAIKEAKKAVDSSVEEKITDEEIIDRIIEIVNDKYKLSKKDK